MCEDTAKGPVKFTLRIIICNTIVLQGCHSIVVIFVV